MSAVIPMAQGALDFAQDLLKRHRTIEGVRVLRRLIAMPDVSPSLAAEANRLLAEIHVRRAEYGRARDSLGEALAGDPYNAEYHFLLARSNDLDAEEGDAAAALTHYAHAAVLAPQDAKKQSAYALQLVKSRRAKRGLAMLEKAYAGADGGPDIVADYAEALLVAERPDDAELLVSQAACRHDGDRRFEQVRRGVVQRVREQRLFGGPSRRDTSEPNGQSRMIVPFRNFEPSEPTKPRGPKRPAARSSSVPVRRAAPPAGPVPLSDQMTLSDVLKRVGRQAADHLYHQLGLIGKEKAVEQRAEIVAALRDPDTLGNLVRGLLGDSRKLLRTVVRAGGFVPASVLFQNTGPDSPPPDYVQPLLTNGLLFFGQDAACERAGDDRLVAVIPVDLLHALARVLRVKPGR